MARKKKTIVYQFVNKDTGEHYPIRMSRDTYEGLADKKVKKFSKKLKKHTEFTVAKLKK